MSGPSGFPYRAAQGMDKELMDYFDKIGKKADAVADLAASPTNAQIATAFNALLAALRDAKKMES